MTSQSLLQSQRQTQRILPQQIQLLNLLQLPVFELEQRIMSEIEENPILERVDLIENAENTEGGIDQESTNENDNRKEEPIDYFNFEEENPNDYASLKPNSEDTYELTAVEISSFQDNLRQQLSFRNMPDKQRALCEYLIGALDDDGYLRRSIEDIADDLSFSLSLFIEEAELEEALKIVQSLDPIGIGSRDLTEFLMLQLREAAREGEDVAIACGLVDGFLNDIAQKNYDRIKQTLFLSDTELQQAIHLLKNLKAKPVMGLARPEEITQHIIPDFIVTTKDDGSLYVTIRSIGSGDLRINNHYNTMLHALENTPNPTQEQKANTQYLRSKVTAAQWFIDALKQREHSLTQTIHTIVDLQQAFFKTGDFKQLRPMILKDIADRVGLGISTISRVTSTRYVQTNFGIIPLKTLFTEGILTDDGKIISNKVIQETVIDIIDSESKKEPFSDQEIADLLAQKGFSIARRTVAKYRETLNIPAAPLRRVI